MRDVSHRLLAADDVISDAGGTAGELGARGGHLLVSKRDNKEELDGIVFATRLVLLESTEATRFVQVAVVTVLLRDSVRGTLQT